MHQTTLSERADALEAKMQIALLTSALARARAVATPDVLTNAHIEAFQTDIVRLEAEWPAACGDQAATSTSAAI